MSKTKQITVVILTTALVLGGIMFGFSKNGSNNTSIQNGSHYDIAEVVTPPTNKQ